MRIAIEHYKRPNMVGPERTKAAIKRLYGDLFGISVDPGEAVVNPHMTSDDDTEDDVNGSVTGEDTIPYVDIPDDVDSGQPETVVPEAVAAPEAVVSVDSLNRYLKLQLRIKEGKPDLTKRDDLSVGIRMLEELAAGEKGGVAAVLDNKVMESKSPAEILGDERKVAIAESDLGKLADAAKFLGEASVKKYREMVEKAGKATIGIGGKEKTIEDRSSEIGKLERQIRVGESELGNTKISSGGVVKKTVLFGSDGKELDVGTQSSSERKDVRDKVEGKIEELSEAEAVNKAFVEREKVVKNLYESLTVLFEHLSVLVENGCFSDPANVKSIKSQRKELASMALSPKYAEMKPIVDSIAGANGILSKDKKDSTLKASDAKRGELTDNLRTDKKKLEFAKKNAEGNTDLTDSAFALRIIKYKLLKDPENAKLSLEDLEKLAKRNLVEELWKMKNGKAMGEAVDGAESDLLKVIGDAVMKEKVLKFSYKVGDSKKEMFKGITPGDLKDKGSIESLFDSGKMDIKKAFMLLGLIGGEGGANTPQYKILQKKIFDLLGEQGLTPAQAMKAFNEQMEKINAVVSQYSSNFKKSSVVDKELRDLKVKKSMESYRRGKIDYDQLQDELEDAGVLKDGKLTDGSVSRLGLYSGYVWNHRNAQKVRDRMWDVTRDTGKFLGWNLAAAPLLLGGKWAVKGGLSLAGSAIAAPFRLVGYPLALLKAPLHILRHPIKVFTKPGEVFKGAGGKVKEKWAAKIKAGQERRAKKWEGAKAELGKWKEPFKKPKYEWKSYEDRVKNDPSKDLGKFDSRIERLKKKSDEATFVLGEEPFLDYSKYKTNTSANEEVKKTA